MATDTVGAAQHQVGPTSVLERVFAILDCFSAEQPELTLAELASRTAIPKPTVHRLAKVLVDQRLLNRTDAGFRLGIRLFELGELVGERRDLRDASLPFLQELFELTHETIHLGVLEGDEVLYFVKIVGYKAFAAADANRRAVAGPRERAGQGADGLRARGSAADPGVDAAEAADAIHDH